MARALLGRPALRVHRDPRDPDVYEVRPRVFGPPFLTTDAETAARMLERAIAE